MEPGALDELKKEMIYVCEEAVSQDPTNVQGDTDGVMIAPRPPSPLRTAIPRHPPRGPNEDRTHNSCLKPIRIILCLRADSLKV